MKKHTGLLYIFYLGLALLSFSCKNSINDIDIASNLVSVNGSIVLMDTFTLRISTTRLDSVATSGYNKALVGTYTDGNFGKISASSYFNISLPSQSSISQFYINEEAVYDSLALLMHINYYYGDTNTVYNLQVNRITSLLENTSLSPWMYNKTQPPQVDSKPLGTFSHTIMPHLVDSFHVTLDNTLGLELFNQFVFDYSIFSDQNLFSRTYKGLALLPTGDNNLVLGFAATKDLAKKNFVMRLYYHYGSLSDKPSLYTDFNLSNADLQYNRITVDPNTTPLAKLTGLMQLPINLTNGEAYVQAGTGYRTKIAIPYLKNLQITGSRIRVVNATLYVTPEIGSNIDIPWPKSLDLYSTTDDNVSFMSLTQGTLTDNSLTNIEYPAFYTFDLTNWVNNTLLPDYNPKVPQLVISPIMDRSSGGANIYPLNDQTSSNLDRLIIKDGNRYKTRMQVMYYRY